MVADLWRRKGKISDCFKNSTSPAPVVFGPGYNSFKPIKFCYMSGRVTKITDKTLETIYFLEEISNRDLSQMLEADGNAIDECKSMYSSINQHCNGGMGPSIVKS